ncbi:hypothetical protein BU14_0488s0001 [Porphyra umbilicalis]|uniref:Uncharacterized protein n=1 Tax=Porphyra umbilicalis TaxID=2786 RepID=A0A1X6NTH8_PORUM|nr:hypothetical protein BU14_0488s0001 [Porphyra umbilicalis]|eukprot:OSX71939.1 hypothetical protein BU14_0488s0001 [Porphyra umbilicalis]
MAAAVVAGWWPPRRAVARRRPVGGGGAGAPAALPPPCGAAARACRGRRRGEAGAGGTAAGGCAPRGGGRTAVKHKIQTACGLRLDVAHPRVGYSCEASPACDGLVTAGAGTSYRCSRPSPSWRIKMHGERTTRDTHHTQKKKKGDKHTRWGSPRPWVAAQTATPFVADVRPGHPPPPVRGLRADRPLASRPGRGAAAARPPVPAAAAGTEAAAARGRLPPAKGTGTGTERRPMERLRGPSAFPPRPSAGVAPQPPSGTPPSTPSQPLDGPRPRSSPPPSPLPDGTPSAVGGTPSPPPDTERLGKLPTSVPDAQLLRLADPLIVLPASRARLRSACLTSSGRLVALEDALDARADGRARHVDEHRRRAGGGFQLLIPVQDATDAAGHARGRHRDEDRRRTRGRVFGFEKPCRAEHRRGGGQRKAAGRGGAAASAATRAIKSARAAVMASWSDRQKAAAAGTAAHLQDGCGDDDGKTNAPHQSRIQGGVPDVGRRESHRGHPTTATARGPPYTRRLCRAARSPGAAHGDLPTRTPPPAVQPWPAERGFRPGPLADTERTQWPGIEHDNSQRTTHADGFSASPGQSKEHLSGVGSRGAVPIEERRRRRGCSEASRSISHTRQVRVRPRALRCAAEVRRRAPLTAGGNNPQTRTKPTAHGEPRKQVDSALATRGRLFPPLPSGSGQERGAGAPPRGRQEHQASADAGLDVSETPTALLRDVNPSRGWHEKAVQSYDIFFAGTRALHAVRRRPMRDRARVETDRQLPLRCPSNTRSDGSRWPIEQGARLELMGARWGFLPDCIEPHRAQSVELPDRKRVDGRYQSRVAHSTGTQDRCRTTCSFLAARQEN